MISSIDSEESFKEVAGSLRFNDTPRDPDSPQRVGSSCSCSTPPQETSGYNSYDLLVYKLKSLDSTALSIKYDLIKYFACTRRRRRYYEERKEKSASVPLLLDRQLSIRTNAIPLIKISPTPLPSLPKFGEITRDNIFCSGFTSDEELDVLKYSRIRKPKEVYDDR